MFAFVLGHVARLLWGLFNVCGGGLLRALWRRTLGGRAAAAGFAILLAVLWGLEAAVHRGYFLHGTLPLWSIVGLSAAAVGLLHGALTPGLGVWESYLACGLATAVSLLRVTGGVQRLFATAAEPSAFALTPYQAPSVWSQVLGPMGGQLVVLVGLAAWVAAIVGGSLAQLLLAQGTGVDLGWRLEWTLARRAWRGTQGAGISAVAAVATLGVALGVASLVTVNAVMSGYQHDIREKILATHAHVVVQKYGNDFVEYPQLMQQAQQVAGVEAAAPFVFNEVLLSAMAQGRGVLLKGIEASRAAQVTALPAQICDPAELPGRCTLGAETGAAAARLTALLGAPQAGELPPLLLGWELYVQLGQPRQAVLSLTVPVGLAGARGGLPQRQDFRLAGVFRGGMYEFDARLVYTDLATAQRLFGMPGRVSGIELRVADPGNIDRLTASLRQAVGRYPYRVNDWRELNAGLFNALAMQKVVMFLVLCCMVVVASFNIAATLFMAVVEKSHAIAVLKSMGARDGQIMKIFVLQGWMVGAAGTLLGLVLGAAAAVALDHLKMGIAGDVYMVDALRVRLQPLDVALVAGASLLIGHLSTLFPALQAAARPPAAALRLET